MSQVNKVTPWKPGTGTPPVSASPGGLLDTFPDSDNGLMDSNETPGTPDAVPSPQLPPSSSVRTAPLWADGLGKAAIRSIQVLAVGALAWVSVVAAARVPLVTTPVLIALILASAMAPVVRWLAGHGWPRALVVLSSFLVIVANMLIDLLHAWLDPRIGAA